MTGRDSFGASTINGPWINTSLDPIAAAKLKADAAFDLVQVLGVPFYTFHDRDITPEGDPLTESIRNLHTMAEYLGRKMQDTGVKLLWVRQTFSAIRVTWRVPQPILTLKSLLTARPQ